MDNQSCVLRGYHLSHRPNAFALKIAHQSTERLTRTLQGWRRSFELKTLDLMLIDDVRLDSDDEAVDDKAFTALNERLIV